MREWAAECQKAETRIVRRRYPATEDLYRCFHERVCGAVLAIALYATYLIAKSQSLPPTPGTTSWKTSWSIVSFALGPVVNLIYSKAVDRGGHFAAWEQPQVFLEELRPRFDRCALIRPARQVHLNAELIAPSADMIYRITQMKEVT